MPRIGPVFDPVNLADEYVKELSHCTRVVLVRQVRNPPVCPVPPWTEFRPELRSSGRLARVCLAI